MALSTKEKWDVTIGLIGALFVGLSILVSVFVYLHGNEEAIRREHELTANRNRVDYERRLWDELRATYATLAQTLGRMASELDATSVVSVGTRSDFNAAYWGTLTLVESECVQLELVKLRNDLRDLEQNRIQPDKIKLRINRIVSLSRQDIRTVIDVAPR